ncbi:DUF6807 family protein [Actinospica sp.]|uniref:DUF6807 family protein n=1 Tax=Actinospica sp. TaxID=1872142 RepID=UPI002B80AE68|nr:DUF6807 family protein [Actinospica sp.]HWG24862.1 DUF6807 family protein [Actinospica sp.]
MSDLEEPRLRVAGRVVADYVLAPDIDPTLVPRPYLHPVRTLAGTVVTDVLPADHEWHLGAGLAIADVAGTNLWGGRSYVHGKGYIRLQDHGSIEHVVWQQHSDSVLEHDLIWRDHEGAELLAEHRTISASPGATQDSWLLTFATTLTNVRPTPVEIRSPATNGRGEGAGYGGFFWRLPPTRDLTIEARDPRTADRARGEGFVNGSALPELTATGTTSGDAGSAAAGSAAGSATAGKAAGSGAAEWTAAESAATGSGAAGSATVRSAVADSAATSGSTSRSIVGKRFALTFSGLAGGDRWFVRATEYPAIGIAFAYNRVLVLDPGGALSRTFSVTVADA